MTICSRCGNGIITIRKGRCFHLFCRYQLRLPTKQYILDDSDLGHGIGLFKKYKCNQCNSYKWGMLMKHYCHADHIHCAEHYHIIDLCRKCFRKRFRKNLKI